MTDDGPAMTDAAATWAQLLPLVRSCVACPELAATRTQVVPGQVVVGAPLVLVGEAPGRDEDETGRPFVGRSGQLLDVLLADAGLARADVSILNVLKCRPPGNRPPRPDEAGRCRPWLDRQLALLQPRVVVPLGLTATRWFLGRRAATLTAVRGHPHEVDGRQVLPTYHPSAALRFGPAGEPRRLLADDLRAAVRLAREAA